MLAQLTCKTHALIAPCELNRGPPLSIQGAQGVAASPQAAFLKFGLNRGLRPVMLHEDSKGRNQCQEGRVSVQGAGDPSPRQASEDHTAAAPDVDGHVHPERVPGRGRLRAEVGLGAQEKCFWNPGKVAREAEAQNGSSMPWSADQSHSGKFTGQWP